MRQNDQEAVTTRPRSAEMTSTASPQPQNCRACSGAESTPYALLTDRLFGVDGQWPYRRCSSSACGSVYLASPLNAELVQSFYEGYYTHDSPTPQTSLGVAISTVWPLARRRDRLENDELFGLGAGNGRRLLDVGCGSGHVLAKFRDNGWEVVGQDIDAEAAKRATERYGVTVHAGPLPEVAETIGMVDAIILSHVIEHEPQPVQLLRACRGLLLEGGKVVIATPNIGSFGHSLFRTKWRGLEPPRHIVIFTMAALRSVLTEAGFSSIEIRTSADNAEDFVRESAALLLGRGRARPASRSLHLALRGLAILLQGPARIMYWISRSSGEEIRVLAGVR